MGTAMSYFSKDAYDRKREYAYRTSADGVERIASYIVANTMQPDDPDAEQRMDELVEELQPIAELSHKRHEIHSTDPQHFAYDISLLTEVGNEYSDGCLIDTVEELNRKYSLVPEGIPYIGDVLVSPESDTTEEILDYYGKEPTGDEDADRNTAVDLVVEDWSNVINTWSSAVRAWFGKLNRKVGSDFPD